MKTYLIAFISLGCYSNAWAQIGSGNQTDVSIYVPIFVAIIGAIATVYASVYSVESKKKDVAIIKNDVAVFKDRLEGLTKPPKIPEGTSRCSVMLLGIGGTGKTTLIERLLPGVPADPSTKTENYEMYWHDASAGTIDKANPDELIPITSARIYVGDYKGQDVGTLIRTFVKQQKESYHPMSYGHINALVLMVDLFQPPANEGEPGPDADTKPNDARIKAHLREWNDTALDAIFGLLTQPSLKLICLFINKFDLITENTDETKDEIMKLYDKLIGRLRIRAIHAGARLEILIGAAEKDSQVITLQRLLVSNSVFGLVEADAVVPCVNPEEKRELAEVE